MKKVKLKDCLRSINYDDGSLRDIVSNEMSKRDWDILLESINSEYNDYSAQNFPKRFSELLKEMNTRELHFIPIKISDKITLIWNLFVSEVNYSSLEISLDPREISDEGDLRNLISFLRWAGTLLRKDISITEENCHNEKILSYIVSTDEFVFFRDCNLYKVQE